MVPSQLHPTCSFQRFQASQPRFTRRHEQRLCEATCLLLQAHVAYAEACLQSLLQGSKVIAATFCAFGSQPSPWGTLFLPESALSHLRCFSCACFQQAEGSEFVGRQTWRYRGLKLPPSANIVLGWSRLSNRLACSAGPWLRNIHRKTLISVLARVCIDT